MRAYLPCFGFVKVLYVKELKKTYYLPDQLLLSDSQFDLIFIQGICLKQFKATSLVLYMVGFQKGKQWRGCHYQNKTKKITNKIKKKYIYLFISHYLTKYTNTFSFFFCSNGVAVMQQWSLQCFGLILFFFCKTQVLWSKGWFHKFSYAETKKRLLQHNKL